MIDSQSIYQLMTTKPRLPQGDPLRIWKRHKPVKNKKHKKITIIQNNGTKLVSILNLQEK